MSKKFDDMNRNEKIESILMDFAGGWNKHNIHEITNQIIAIVKGREEEGDN